MLGTPRPWCPYCNNRVQWNIYDASLEPMPEPTSFTQRAFDALRRELVVIAPLVLAFLAIVPGGTSVTDYKVWGPLLIGFLLRQFVTSPTFEVGERVDAAHDRGYRVGRVIGRTDAIADIAGRAHDEFPPPA